MRNALTPLATVLALALAGGCVVLPKKTYEARSLEVPTNQVVLMASVLQEIADSGWRVVRMDAGRGLVEALAPEEFGSGVTTRERWVFRVEDARVAVAMRLEMKTDFVWRTHETVCEGYEYLRERTKLHAVALRALPPAAPADVPPSAAAALLIAMDDGDTTAAVALLPGR